LNSCDRFFFSNKTMSNRWGPLGTKNSNGTVALLYQFRHPVFWFSIFIEVKSVISSTTTINSCINAGVSAFQFLVALASYSEGATKKKSLNSQNSDTKWALSLIRKQFLSVHFQVLILWWERRYAQIFVFLFDQMLVIEPSVFSDQILLLLCTLFRSKASTSSKVYNSLSVPSFQIRPKVYNGFREESFSL
jgi:hypothetical protein